MKVRVINGSVPGNPDLGMWDLACPPADRDLIVGPDGYAYQVQGPAVWFPDTADGAMAVVTARNTGQRL